MQVSFMTLILQMSFLYPTIHEFSVVRLRGAVGRRQTHSLFPISYITLPTACCAWAESTLFNERYVTILYHFVRVQQGSISIYLG
jgi:hypothetical protein